MLLEMLTVLDAEYPTLLVTFFYSTLNWKMRCY